MSFADGALFLDCDQTEDLEGLNELTGVPCLGVCRKTDLILTGCQVRVVLSEVGELHATRFAHGGTTVDHVTAIDLPTQNDGRRYSAIGDRID